MRWKSLVTAITSALKELERMGKLYIPKTTGLKLPKDLEKEARRVGAKRGDVKLIKLAFHRRAKGRKVVVLSRNSHLRRDLKGALAREGVKVIEPEEYLGT